MVAARLTGQRVGVREAEHSFKRTGQLHGLIAQIFLHVAGNFGFAVQGGQTVNKAKKLHSQAGIAHGKPQQFVIPAHLVTHLGKNRAIFTGRCQKLTSDRLGLSFVLVLNNLCDHGFINPSRQ